MFGILYLLTGIIGNTGWSIKENRRNRECAQRTYDSKTKTYIDMYGVERTLDGKYCHTTRNPYTGDLVQYDKNHKIVRNFSEEERIKIANQSDSTVIKMSEINTHNEDQYIAGVRFVDKNTKDEYVIRSFRVEPDNSGKGYCVYFYMNALNGNLVRITDGEKKYGNLKDETAIQNFIINYNLQQSNRKCLSFREKYNSYFNGTRQCEDRKPFKLY